MSFAPQLAFNGECREAFKFYADLLNGKITVMNSFGENEDVELPPGSTKGKSDHIRFAEVSFDWGALRGNDLGEKEFVPMRGFNLSLHLDTVLKAERVFAGLAKGGTVSTALAEVPWAKRFGMLTDRFGVPWLILAIES